MAVVNVVSQTITDLTAVPVVKTNNIERGGFLKCAADSAAFAASDDTSVARVLRVKSGDRVHQLLFASDDLGTGGTVDVGLHQTAENGGAVVDADFFASAINTDSAAVVWTDITQESGVIDIIAADQPIWQQLALTADPGIEYDVTVTRNTAAGTGDVALKMVYVSIG
jgi:hypothetical protein